MKWSSPLGISSGRQLDQNGRMQVNFDLIKGHTPAILNGHWGKDDGRGSSLWDYGAMGGVQSGAVGHLSFGMCQVQVFTNL